MANLGAVAAQLLGLALDPLARPWTPTLRGREATGRAFCRILGVHQRTPLTWPRFARLFVPALAATAFLAVAQAVVFRVLTFNTTPSLPRGVYRLRPGERPQRGDVVAFPIPQAVASLIESRRYLPGSFSLLKRLVALPGDRVCLDGGRYVVNDAVVSEVVRVDSLGRPLPAAFPFCGSVPAGFGFVATPAPTSLDSRFFGPLPLDALTPAEALWTHSSR